ncbi:MAG: GrpB family protein [Gemmatimonadota bacterium]
MTQAPALGLESGVVRVVPYDTRWPVLFIEERQRLVECFDRARLTVALEHIGSTSIPGLAAKPILDILAGYPADAAVADYIHVLVNAGYTHRGEQGIPGREFFRIGVLRSHHLHMAVEGGAIWRDQLLFRDRLRANDRLRDEYAALKAELARRHPRDREAYIEGKGEFVRGVIAG